MGEACKFTNMANFYYVFDKLSTIFQR